MKDYKKIINNIVKETQLLESLGWDEDLLKELYEYLDVHFSGDSIITPKLLLKEVVITSVLLLTKAEQKYSQIQS